MEDVRLQDGWKNARKKDMVTLMPAHYVTEKETRINV